MVEFSLSIELRKVSLYSLFHTINTQRNLYACDYDKSCTNLSRLIGLALTFQNEKNIFQGKINFVEKATKWFPSYMFAVADMLEIHSLWYDQTKYIIKIALRLHIFPRNTEQ